MMNSTPGSSSSLSDLPENTIVYDVNGEKVGKVIFSALRDGYFVVEQGWFFSHQLFLPFTAIQGRTVNDIMLRLSKEELKADQWKQPPMRTDAAAAQPSVPPSAAARDPNPIMGKSDNASVDPVIPANDPPIEDGQNAGGVINLPPPEAEPPLENR